jgi:hypothetical protein
VPGKIFFVSVVSHDPASYETFHEALTELGFKSRIRRGDKFYALPPGFYRRDAAPDANAAGQVSALVKRALEKTGHGGEYIVVESDQYVVFSLTEIPASTS